MPVLLVLSHLTCTSTYYTFTEVVANAGRKVSYISGSVLLHEHENSMQSLPGDSILVYENLLPTPCLVEEVPPVPTFVKVSDCLHLV